MIIPQLFASFGEIQKMSNRKWVKLKEKYVKESGGEKNQTLGQCDGRLEC